MAAPNFSSIVPSFVQGGHTSLLLGPDQEASVSRKLYFNEQSNDSTFDE
jgi:hypothetical protein